VGLENQIGYWLEGSAYDLETAEAILESKRFLYVGFCCHLGVKKNLKGFLVKKLSDTAPFTHHLLVLANKCDLTSTLSEDDLNFLNLFTTLNIEDGYSGYKSNLARSLNQVLCTQLLTKTKLLCKKISPL